MAPSPSLVGSRTASNESAEEMGRGADPSTEKQDPAKTTSISSARLLSTDIEQTFGSGCRLTQKNKNRKTRREPEVNRMGAELGAEWEGKTWMAKHWYRTQLCALEPVLVSPHLPLMFRIDR